MNTPRATAALAGLIALAVVALRLTAFGDDLSWFVDPGDRFVDPKTRVELRVEAEHDGYDGQFFYRLAIEPLTRAPVDHGIRFDAPAYRQQRILYPTLAWALSGGGHAPLLPYVLLAINVLGLAALGWLGGVAAREGGHHALLGLALPLYPGFFYTLVHDLSEITAAVSAVAALLALRKDRLALGALLLSLAVLTRETTFLLVLGTGAAAVWRRDARLAAVALVPAAVLAAWHATLWSIWGVTPVGAGSGNLGAPLAGLAGYALAQALRVVQTASPSAIVTLIEIAFLVYLSARALLARATVPARETWALVLALGLGLCLTQVVWVSSTAFLRALTEVGVLGVLAVLAADPRAARAALVFGAATWTWCTFATG